MHHLFFAAQCRQLLLAALLLLSVSAVFAQDTARRTWVDTGSISLFGDESEHVNVSYVHSIESAYETLNRVQNNAALNYNILGIRQQVTDDDSALSMIRQGGTWAQPQYQHPQPSALPPDHT
jgi:hypothetical protein